MDPHDSGRNSLPAAFHPTLPPTVFLALIISGLLILLHAGPLRAEESSTAPQPAPTQAEIDAVVKAFEFATTHPELLKSALDKALHSADEELKRKQQELDSLNRRIHTLNSAGEILGKLLPAGQKPEPPALAPTVSPEPPKSNPPVAPPVTFPTPTLPTPGLRAGTAPGRAIPG